MPNHTAPRIVMNEEYLDLRQGHDCNSYGNRKQTRDINFGSQRKSDKPKTVGENFERLDYENSLSGMQTKTCRRSKTMDIPIGGSKYERSMCNSPRTRNILEINPAEFSREKERINTGLKKLANVYNATANSYHKESSRLSAVPPKSSIGPPSSVDSYRREVNPNMFSSYTDGKHASTTSKRKHRVREKSMIVPRIKRLLEPEGNKLKSLSEFSIIDKKAGFETNTPSAPLMKNKKCSSITIATTKPDPVRDRSTMTKYDKCGKIIKPRKCRSKSVDWKMKLSDNTKNTEQTNYALIRNLDPRLCEKYSILKIPWKRRWTLPIFSPSTTANVNDNIDRRTYVYDDGSEVDSLYVDEKRREFFCKAFHNQCMGLLFFSGTICGLLIVTLLFWYIFGHDFLSIFFKPRKLQEGVLKKGVKYMSSKIIRAVTYVFHTLGQILATPTQKVYYSPPDYHRWPIQPIPPND